MKLADPQPAPRRSRGQSGDANEPDRHEQRKPAGRVGRYDRWRGADDRVR